MEGLCFGVWFDTKLTVERLAALAILGERCSAIARIRLQAHQGAMEPLRVPAGVERQEARIDAPLAQRRQELEQVLLRAADSLHLREMEHSQRASSSR